MGLSRRFTAAFILIFSLVFFCGCKTGVNKNGESLFWLYFSNVEGPLWFVLSDGDLVPVDKPSGTAEGLIPWTDQERISGFFEGEGALVAAVNGYGFLSFPLLEEGIREPEKSYNPDILRGRTLGRLFFREGRLSSQVYENTIFSEEPADGQSFLFAEHDIAGQNIIPIAFPLQIQEEGWEGVDLIAGEHTWYIAWKKSDENRTEFRYHEHYISGDVLSVLDSASFFSYYRFRNMPATEPGLYKLLSPFLEMENRVYHFILSAPLNPEFRRYILGDELLLESGEADLICIPMFISSGSASALLPGETIIRWRTAGSHTPSPAREPGFQTLSLPALPEGFVYEHIWMNEKAAFVSWEERSFIFTGSSGVLIFPLPPL